MPKLTKTYRYECPFPTCSEHMIVHLDLSAFPECHGTHHRDMDFIEKDSTGVPEHILKAGLKSVRRDEAKVRGGNWIRD
jgi:hypothetical protein